MIRVILPYHLRNLAGVSTEIQLEVPEPVTQHAILDALEAKFPALKGTIRDHVSKESRPFIRFFVCSEDWTHQPSGTPLPAAITSGEEPFLVIGAIAGG